MADRHDAYSACTEPASENFAQVCREYAALLRGQAGTSLTEALIAELGPLIGAHADIVANHLAASARFALAGGES